MVRKRPNKCANCGHLIDFGAVHLSVVDAYRHSIRLYFCSFLCLRTALLDKDNKSVKDFERRTDHPYDEKGETK